MYCWSAMWCSRSPAGKKIKMLLNSFPELRELKRLLQTTGFLRFGSTYCLLAWRAVHLGDGWEILPRAVWSGSLRGKLTQGMAQCITYWPLLLKTDRRNTPQHHLYMVLKCSLLCFLMVKHKTSFFADPLCSCQVVKMPFFFSKTVKDVAITEKWSVK